MCAWISIPSPFVCVCFMCSGCCIKLVPRLELSPKHCQTWFIIIRCQADSISQIVSRPLNSKYHLIFTHNGYAITRWQQWNPKYKIFVFFNNKKFGQQLLGLDIFIWQISNLTLLEIFLCGVLSIITHQPIGNVTPYFRGLVPYEHGAKFKKVEQGREKFLSFLGGVDSDWLRGG
jgi:hypothetical protein